MHLIPTESGLPDANTCTWLCFWAVRPGVKLAVCQSRKSNYSLFRPVFGG